jgi:hypothetical protein
VGLAFPVACSLPTLCPSSCVSRLNCERSTWPPSLLVDTSALPSPARLPANFSSSAQDNFRVQVASLSDQLTEVESERARVQSHVGQLQRDLAEVEEGDLPHPSP